MQETDSERVISTECLQEDRRVLVYLKDKVLDLTNFAKVHPGGKSTISRYRGRQIDGVIFNPSLHRHDASIIPTLLSYELKQSTGPDLRKTH